MRRTADRLLGGDYTWSALGAGANQLRIAAQSAAMGGHVRVGLEDSLWAGPGTLATSGAERIALAKSILTDLSLTVATPADAREVLGIKRPKNVNF